MKHPGRLLQNSLISGSLLMLIGSNFANFSGYLYHLVVGRMLGPANYGELLSLFSVLGLLAIIPTAVSLVIIKFISELTVTESTNLIHWIGQKVFLIGLVVSLMLVLLAYPISNYLRLPHPIYLYIVAFCFLFSVSSLANRAILQGLLKFNQLTFSNIIENMVKVGASVIS